MMTMTTDGESGARPRADVRRCRQVTAVALWLGMAVAAAQNPGPPQPQMPVPGPQQEEEIRGPKPKVEIPVPEKFDPTALIAAGAALAVAAGAFLWWRHHSPRRREVAAGDRAIKALHEVDRERNNLEPGPLADRAAGVVRRFVAERFGIAAPQRTTEEFLRMAEQAPPLAPHRELLHGFLQSCDAAKFAGAGFDAAERLALLQNATQFVRSAAAWQPPPPPAVKPPAA